MPALKRRKYTICVFLDLSDCTDTIARCTLLEKLHINCVRGKSLVYIKSYFPGGTKYINALRCKSEVEHKVLRVIQRSKYGPTFFDVYILTT